MLEFIDRNVQLLSSNTGLVDNTIFETFQCHPSIVTSNFSVWLVDFGTNINFLICHLTLIIEHSIECLNAVVKHQTYLMPRDSSSPTLSYKLWLFSFAVTCSSKNRQTCILLLWFKSQQIIIWWLAFEARPLLYEFRICHNI